MTKTSRRAIIAGAAAAVAATTTPVNAAPSADADPIFAAILRYRDARRAFFARAKLEDEMCEAEAGIKLVPAPDDYRTPDMVAAVNASRATRAELANTAPTTLAGLTTLLDFVVAESFDEMMFDGDDEIRDFVRSLARSARAMAVQS